MFYKNIVLVFFISILLSTCLGKIFIPILKRLKFRQKILSCVSEHAKKDGTPTMGGLFFILSGIIVSLLFIKDEKHLSLFCLSITFSYMTVGFLDDFIKIKNGRNLGLRAYQKILFQLSIAIICGFFCYKSKLTMLYLPFINKTINVGKWIILISIFVFLATTNTVNLTDGLDGLAGSVSLVYLIGLVLLIFTQISVNKHLYIISNEYNNLIRICISFCGAIAGFLIFNTYKATVFMGDTGSLGLGGLIASVSIVSGNMFYIPIMGITFVMSGLSVILQVLYFKITKGKRIFLMAPLHHHFQHKGYAESKIVYAYTILTILGVLVSLFSFL